MSACETERVINFPGNINLKVVKTIAKTLQGCIILCINKETNKKVVLKVASIKLHHNGITLAIPNKIIKVNENIFKEAQIMEYLKTKNPPKGTMT